MKRYVKANTISKDILQKAIGFAESNKRSKIDLQNHIIQIPASAGVTEDLLMEDGMLGKWFVDNGFDVSFEVGDFEYTTKGEFNVRSMRKSRGHTAYLRNRTIMTITW